MIFNLNNEKVLFPLLSAPVVGEHLNKISIYPEQYIDQLTVYSAAGSDEWMNKFPQMPKAAVEKIPTYLLFHPSPVASLAEKTVIYQAANSTSLDIHEFSDDMLLNAPFLGDLEGGNIGLGESSISAILVEKASKESDYTQFNVIATVPLSGLTTFSVKDYLINSGEVYVYAIQPYSQKRYGLTQAPVAALNMFEYSWIIDSDGSQLRIPDCSIATINVISKDNVFETIGGQYPFVNRSSNLNYKTFQISGTMAYELDKEKTVATQAESLIYGRLGSQTRNLVAMKYAEKFPDRELIPSSEYNYDIYENYQFERAYREQLLKMLGNGKPKIFKSDTEGLLKIKLSNITLTPKTALGRVLYDFSATATEIGSVSPEDVSEFNLFVGDGILK